MSDDVVLYEVSDGIAVVTINRPKALNALNSAVLAGLGAAFRRAGEEGVRGVVLTGAGPKAFVAGADIAEMKDLTSEQAEGFARSGQAVFDRIANFAGVVVAAVGGFALGGGMELAMACDLIIAAENARFGQPEVNLGVIPGFGGTQRLVRLVGVQRARELVFTARMVKAPEAVTLGIALEVVEAGTAVDRAKAILGGIATKGPLAIEYAKKAVNGHLDGTLADGLANEASLFGACFLTEDQTEGMTAFVEKRAASFRGA
ncbi:MAG: enoyl-CoA hydratase/isomerase family protein [Deltaproteobacteria bacterium]|nr:enoyl-CoA hydratase/isomerase family protein [Deltaproteobacteria bacterium]